MTTPRCGFYPHFKCSSRQWRWTLYPGFSSSRPMLLTFPAVQLEVWSPALARCASSLQGQRLPHLSTQLLAGSWWRAEKVLKSGCAPSASCHPLPAHPTYPGLPLQPCREAQAAWLLCHHGTRPIWYQSANTNSCLVLQGGRTWWQNALNQSLPCLCLNMHHFVT